MALTQIPSSMLANAGAELGMRNRIINGDMRIDQRNAGASVTPTDGQYLVDRWVASLTAASKYTAQRSTTAPTEFTASQLITSSSAYSVAVGDIFAISQKIEGYNFSDMAWGTASAKTVTLSFWVRSSLTGTFGGAFTNSATNRSYPFTYSISAANTWEQKTVTIAGDTTGTWVTDNGIGVRVYFGLGVGSTYSGTAGSWAAAGYFSATGATSVVGTNGATFYITGVQVEAGSTATPFERRPYGMELALCQRYYQIIPATYGFGYCSGNTVIYGGGGIALKTSMRIAPSLDSNKSGTFGVSGGSAGTTNLAYATTETVNFQNGAANWTASTWITLATAAGLTAEL